MISVIMLKETTIGVVVSSKLNTGGDIMQIETKHFKITVSSKFVLALAMLYKILHNNL